MVAPPTSRRRSVVVACGVGVVAYVVVRRLRRRGRKSRQKSAQAVPVPDGPSDVLGDPGAQQPQRASTADAELLRGRSRTGSASRAPETIPSLIDRLASNSSKALAWEAAPSKDGGFTEWTYATWTEYVDEIRRAAAGFVALGLHPRESVAIIGFNSKEWLVADLAAILAGGFATGIYATNGVDAARYIIQHARARIVVCEGLAQARKIDAAVASSSSRSSTPPSSDGAAITSAIVAYGPAASEACAEMHKQRRSTCEFLAWPELLARPFESPAAAAEVSRRAAAQSPGACSTLIYTSGTTGNPKAVMVSHDNITWVVGAFAEFVAFGCLAEQRFVSYLPLSHIAAQAIDIFAGLCTVGRLVDAATLYFAKPDALKGSLKQTLCAARPTVFFGVPRVFEKFAEALQAVGAKTTGLKKKVSTWAKKVARRKYDRLRLKTADDGVVDDAGGLVGALEEVLASKVLKKVHAAIGLDACYFVFTGAAPIATSTLEYFGSLDLVVNEVFGMSECTGPATVTLNPYFFPGCCGVAIPGVEVKLDHVEGRDAPGEGEVLFRGRSVMLGYLDNDAKTRETIDDDGWLHSGDTGRLVVPRRGDDDAGLAQAAAAAPLLKITGRIKELLITAGGENVAPVPIEDALKDRLAPGLVSNVVVVGDKLKFLACLVTLKQRPNEATASFDADLADNAATLDPTCRTAADAADSPLWKATIQAAIDDYNATTAVSAAQKIQKFAVLPLDFSQATGELTPTLKLKRAAVVAKYAATLKTLYGSAASAVWQA